MSLAEQIQKDMVDAMRARDERRLSALRMIKSAIKYKEIDKRSALDDKEVLRVLGTLVKQRKDSIEQFTKGNRMDLADKETAELKIIESYMPKGAGDAEILAVVRAVIAEMGAPTIKDMGTIMKSVLAKFAVTDTRVDGRVVNETVRRELSGPVSGNLS